MKPNPILAKLGFSASDRLVIIHADDIGMCQATLQAFQDLWENEALTSGAVMVPCPWFPAAAAMYRQNPSMDLGGHLVLTSEWEYYRWRPLTAALTGSSLVDGEGFFPRSVDDIQAGPISSAYGAKYHRGAVFFSNYNTESAVDGIVTWSVDYALASGSVTFGTA